MKQPEQQKNVTEMTGEEIALALQARYQGLAQLQQELALLNQELQKRMNPVEAVKSEESVSGE